MISVPKQQCSCLAWIAQNSVALNSLPSTLHQSPATLWRPNVGNANRFSSLTQSHEQDSGMVTRELINNSFDVCMFEYQLDEQNVVVLSTIMFVVRKPLSADSRWLPVLRVLRFHNECLVHGGYVECGRAWTLVRLIRAWPFEYNEIGETNGVIIMWEHDHSLNEKDVYASVTLKTLSLIQLTFHSSFFILTINLQRRTEETRLSYFSQFLAVSIISRMHSTCIVSQIYYFAVATS